MRNMKLLSIPVLAVLAALTFSAPASANPEPTTTTTTVAPGITTTEPPTVTTDPATTLPLCDEYPDHSSCVTTTTAAGCTVINGCLPAPCQPARQYCGPPLSTPIDAPPLDETSPPADRATLPSTGSSSALAVGAVVLLAIGFGALLVARRP